ncbi:transposase [bacterium]|nr:transposase [bacterium]
MRKQIKELTLLLLWLTSWDESKQDKQLNGLGPIYRSWKGYDFDILNELKEEKLISGSHKAKSVYLTEKGIKEAKKLEKKYLSKRET